MGFYCHKFEMKLLPIVNTIYSLIARHCLVRMCLLHCLCVHLCNGYTRAYVQIKQHTHTHKTVGVRVKAKKLLSHRRQSDYRSTFTVSTASSGSVVSSELTLKWDRQLYDVTEPTTPAEDRLVP